MLSTLPLKLFYNRDGRTDIGKTMWYIEIAHCLKILETLKKGLWFAFSSNSKANNKVSIIKTFSI